jgi:hypothetical protein
MAIKELNFGANFTIFLLFFGVAALEAFQSRNWLKAAFWLVIGLVFWWADNKGGRAGEADRQDQR